MSEDLLNQLRDIIANAEESRYSMSKATGISESHLAQFMAGTKGPRTRCRRYPAGTPGLRDCREEEAPKQGRSVTLASVSFDRTKNRFRVRFVAPDGSRPCLSLSIRKNEKRNGAEKRAHSLLSHVEQLIECRATGRTLDNSLSKWIDGLKPGHRKTAAECRAA